MATNEEQRWMNWIVDHGCVVCRSPALVHHLLSGGRRVGHLDTIPLCYLHHQSGRNDKQVVSRHPWRKQFEQRYGTEQELLNNLRRKYER